MTNLDDECMKWTNMRVMICQYQFSREKFEKKREYSLQLVDVLVGKKVLVGPIEVYFTGNPKDVVRQKKKVNVP